MTDIVISEFMEPGAVDGLRRDFDVLYDPELVDRTDDLAASLHAARALIVRNRTRVDRTLLSAAPDLLVIGRLGVGLDNIDVDACRARNVAVHPATGANSVAVAEYVVAGILMLLRGAYGSSAEVLTGAWPRSALVGREAAGRKLGLVGFGGIAREVARRARALGLDVAAHDPFVADDDPVWRQADVAPMDLDALMAACDAISLHVPLSDGTRRLIGPRRLALMRPGAVLINSARGGVVDETALADALRAGRIGGAMLDVFETEPLAAGSTLNEAPNLIVTPHIAGITEESLKRVSETIAATVRQILSEAGDGPATADD